MKVFLIPKGKNNRTRGVSWRPARGLSRESVSYSASGPSLGPNTALATFKNWRTTGLGFSR